MLRIRHILLPYDFSAPSEAMGPPVAAIAQQFQARITILSVVPPVWQNSPSEPKAAETLFDPKRLQAELEHALREDFRTLAVERVWQRGDPASIITDFAHSKRADLIMMPTHGYGPFRSLLLGSVTAKVLHDARCPVWTTAHTEDAAGAGRANGNDQVLCAVDGTHRAVPLMKWAADWVYTTGAELRLVRAVERVTDFPMLKSERALQEEARQDAESSLLKQRAEAGLDAPAAVCVGDVGDVVHQEALHCGANLVVIGRGVLHGTLGRLRTHAYGIIRQSPCPVLSV